MSRWFKLLLVLGLIIPVIWGTGRLYFFLTDGFSVSNIRSELAFRDSWKTEAPGDDVNAILSQDFTYLAKGCQFYTFLSDDGQYVLKFFKHKHLRDPLAVKAADFAGFKSYAEEQRGKKAEKINTLFMSCKLAYDELRDETGVIGVHLNKTTDEIKGKTTIFDKLGFAHTIDLNEFEFVLQRAALPVYRTIDVWISAGEVDKAKRALKQMIGVVVSRCEKGIADRDPAFMQNMGLLQDGDALIVDIGQLAKDESLKRMDAQLEDIRKRADTFRPWLSMNHPELLEYFDSIIFSNKLQDVQDRGAAG